MSKVTPEVVLEAIRHLAAAGQREFSSTDVISATQGSSATVRRHLDALCASGQLTRSGQARATRYRLSDAAAAAKPAVALAPPEIEARLHPTWSFAAIDLNKKLDVPLAARDPVTYQRDFVENYVPNESWLMPKALAEAYSPGRKLDITHFSCRPPASGTRGSMLSMRR